jgi:alpha-galactosidase
MDMKFRGLEFEVVEGRIYLTNFMGMASCKNDIQKKHFDFVDIHVAGSNYDSRGSAKQHLSSETESLRYISYTEAHNELTIVQANDRISVVTHFVSYDDTNTIRVWNDVTNISDKPIRLEAVSSFMCYGFGDKGTFSVKELNLYKFYNSWHIECQPTKLSFYQLGLFNGNDNTCYKYIGGSNTGSWSTKGELPQSIVEDSVSGKFFMFQIESNASWHYQFGDLCGLIYCNIGGPNMEHNQWSKVLAPGQNFSSIKVSVVVGESINEVVGEMTKFRRHIVRPNLADKNLPTIFNEYMHFSWDCPTEEHTKLIAPIVSKLGAKYYVIDCGWHDECDAKIIYKYVGCWRESKVRFPSGLQKTIDFIKSLGLKPGLWIEPEIIGYLNDEMNAFYDEDCFFHRNGELLTTADRRFLDYRKDKVKKYMTETIDRMVAYGVEYIKLDYNQDCGPGNDQDSDSLGDGLLDCAHAFLEWIESMMDKYPNVVFEACASGGQRMDYKTLSKFSVTSTSDQTDYKKYPCIAGNILSAVLPEQAAVWSYPVVPEKVDLWNDTDEDDGVDIWKATSKEICEKVSHEQVIINMINSFLGRMHLASALYLLDDERLALVKEGIEYYDSITPAKKEGLPYLPWGFTDFYQDKVASGFIANKTLYLALWNRKGDGKFEIDIPEYKVKSAKITYPKASTEGVSVSDHKVSVELPKGYSARFIEVTLA